MPIMHHNYCMTLLLTESSLPKWRVSAPVEEDSLRSLCYACNSCQEHRTQVCTADPGCAPRPHMVLKRRVAWYN